MREAFNFMSPPPKHLPVMITTSMMSWWSWKIIVADSSPACAWFGKSYRPRGTRCPIRVFWNPRLGLSGWARRWILIPS